MPLILGGSSLLLCQLLVAAISPRFAYEAEPLAKPVLALVAVLVSAGVVFMLLVRRILHVPQDRASLVWMIAFGLAMRGILLPSTPILEDDYYRYLLDGVISARGANPYAYSPQKLLDAQRIRTSIPDDLHELARASGPVLSRINHPTIRTGYPPIAQAAFALAAWLHPWSLVTWRVVLLGLDVVVLTLLLGLLRMLALPTMWSILYWWNPLVIKEIFNSGHMDVVALVFVLAAVLLAVRQMHMGAAGVLALAVGAKVWPAVLLPVLLRPVLDRPGKWLPAVLVFACLAGALLAPVVFRADSSDGAYTNYAARWQNNAAAFQGFVWVARIGHEVLGYPPCLVQRSARVLVVLVYCLWLAWIVRKPVQTPQDLLGRCLLAVAALFLLSPTAFPWYYTWLVPFLAVRPHSSLLLLTPLLPLYYLRYFLEPRGLISAFDSWVVLAEFLPVWCLLAWEWRAGRAWPDGMPAAGRAAPQPSYGEAPV